MYDSHSSHVTERKTGLKRQGSKWVSRQTSVFVPYWYAFARTSTCLAPHKRRWSDTVETSKYRIDSHWQTFWLQLAVRNTVFSSSFSLSLTTLSHCVTQHSIVQYSTMDSVRCAWLRLFIGPILELTVKTMENMLRAFDLFLDAIERNACHINRLFGLEC